ncbi:hypothetical protein [Cyclobacterium marinum]|nr:hypothetical protein [Cyclobacterium marinum]MBR9777539.1 hypothetical protein [Cytophagales bacterium]
MKEKKLHEGKMLIELIRRILQAIERDDFILAQNHIKNLEIVSLKLAVGGHGGNCTQFELCKREKITGPTFPLIGDFFIAFSSGKK